VQNHFGIENQYTIVIPSIELQTGGRGNPSPSPVTGECNSSNIGSRCGSGSTTGTCDNSNRCIPNSTSLNERPIYVDPKLVPKGGKCSITPDCVSGLTCTPGDSLATKTCE
jgi:hypothetical protein